jgi:hypothetical protein
MNALATLEEYNNLVVILHISRKKDYAVFVTSSSWLTKMPLKRHSELEHKYSFSSVMWQARCINNINLYHGNWHLWHRLRVNATLVHILQCRWSWMDWYCRKLCCRFAGLVWTVHGRSILQQRPVQPTKHLLPDLVLLISPVHSHIRSLYLPIPTLFDFHTRKV